MRHILAFTVTLVIVMTRPAWAQTPATTPLFDEPRIMEKAIARVEDYGGDDDGEPSDGFYPEFGNMITGSGWIAAGPGYRRHVFGRRAQLDMSAAISWRAYKIAQAQLEFPHIANERVSLGSKVLWKDFTQVRYFGAGVASSKLGVSDYRLQATNVVGYAAWRARDDLHVIGTVGWLSRPEVSSSNGTFDREDPDTLAIHFGEPGTGLAEQPQFVHTELTLVNDTRDEPSYPTRGSLARAMWSTYRDQETGTFSFDRYEVEAAYFVPLFDRIVVAAHAWGVFSDTDAGNAVPFYLLPSLGGHNTLRGYSDYRFHDRHLVVANVEARVPVLAHVDAAAFFDAGNVAARVDDLNFDRTSVGVGVRLHTRKTTLARFDVGHSVEGWRFMLKLSDLLRLGRLGKRTAALPFVP